MAATVQEVVEVFLDWIRDNKAANTAKQYSTRLRPFAAAFPGREFASLEPLEIDRFLTAAGKFPDGRLKAPDTRRINVIAIQQIQRFALEKRVINAAIVGKLPKPAGRKRERLPTDDEIKIILQHSSPEFARIYRAYLTTAARPYELAAATFEHWHRDRKMIVLPHSKTSEKTGRDCKIPVGDVMAGLLLEATAGRTSGALFLSPRGQPWTSAGLTQTFTRIRNKAGLSRELVLYLARHKAASVMCKAKGIHATKEALNHASIVTTQRYVHTEDSELINNQDAVGNWIPSAATVAPVPPPSAPS